MTDKQYFCTVANDGVAVCVCKYRPCEKLKRKEQECEELKKTIQLQNKMQMEVVEEKNKEIENLRERNNFLIVRDKMLVDCEKKLQEKEQECEELRNLFEDPKVRIALTDVRTGEREIWRKLGNKAQKYKQALETLNKNIDK